MPSTQPDPHYLRRISQRRIDPPAVTPATALPDLIDQALSGALTPAGLGMSCLVPLIEAGFIDWIVSTGANLYHDTHFALGMDLHQSRPGLNDEELREHQVIRIYDIVFD